MKLSGWWFGTFLFFHILGMSSSQLAFQRGRPTTNQLSNLIEPDDHCDVHGTWGCITASEYFFFFCVHILFLVHAKLAFGNGQFTIDVIDDSPMKTLTYRAPSHG